jgi:HAD superfamily hydrolase (TIGR01509 family)
MLKALILDCDGVLVDTEKDGHRVAFNRAFAEKGLAVEWDVPLYGELLKIAGGKERMRHYFEKHDWPKGFKDPDAFIKDLHKSKTDQFMEIINSGQLPLRPGVMRIIDEAIANRVTLAVCSTSNERAVNLIVEKLLGPERKEQFVAILAGDVVARKKPDPEIYNLAQKTLKVQPGECMVIEDSRNGLQAAKAAGMYCVITMNDYTEGENFANAELIVPELGDGDQIKVTLDILKAMVSS